MRLDEIDKNLKVDREIDKTGLKFYHFEQAPFKIYGKLERGADDRLYRVPREVAANTNTGVLSLCTNTAGGRVRFKTDSKRVAIIAKYSDNSEIYRANHFPITGSAGLDLYEEQTFLGGFVPPFRVSAARDSLPLIFPSTPILQTFISDLRRTQPSLLPRHTLTRSLWFTTAPPLLRAAVPQDPAAPIRRFLPDGLTTII